MIQSLGGGLGSIALAGMFDREASAAARPPHFTPRAKRVIQLFMNGGPFHGDLFDPKPMLAKYAGQRPQSVELRTERKTAGLLPSPYRFEPHGESGVPVSELLPQFAKCIDDVCVLRSLYTDNPNHGPALLQMNNGTIAPTRPSMGSWFSYGLGTENDNLPGYVVLCPGRPVRFSILWSSAFLPGEHQGTYINNSNLAPEKLIPFLRNSTVSLDDQRRQLNLMQQLNEEHLQQRGADPLLEARLQAMETAFRMQTAATEAFDVAREPASVREAYGSGHFANACLLARRLAERGVRFTQIYYGNGRDHNHYGFTMWLAGGGVKGGMTYGETDEFGFRAAQNPVHIHDLHATILHLLGLDHERLTYRYAGRDFRLTDVYGNVIREILA
jgi:hypothetical protein